MLSKTVVRKDRTQLIVCACGCGNTLLKYHPVEGYERKFINGHNVNLDKINRNWKGGHLTDKGYRRIARKNPLEHRRVYEQYYKCCLIPYTDIHHKDGNKLNNDISNLEALTHSKHSLLTWKKRKNNNSSI